MIKIATTWIKPTYAHKRYNNRTTIKRKIDYIIDRQKTTLNDDDHTSAVAISAKSDYIQNPDKTSNRELVTGYECFPETADEQFAISLDLYEQNTRRKHTDNSRPLYHMRQTRLCCCHSC